MPTLLNFDTFAHGVTSTAGNLYTAVAGSPAIITTSRRESDPASLNINTSAAAENIAYADFGGTPTRVVAGF